MAAAVAVVLRQHYCVVIIEFCAGGNSKTEACTTVRQFLVMLLQQLREHGVPS